MIKYIESNCIMVRMRSLIIMCFIALFNILTAAPLAISVDAIGLTLKVKPGGPSGIETQNVDAGASGHEQEHLQSES